MIPALFSLALIPISAAPVKPMKTFTIHLDQPRQTIDNFAASDSWTVEPLIHWPEAKRKEVARLLFDQEHGAGLSGWRFNLGGGINHETITVPFRTADTFDAGEGQYDFSRCPGQRWMLKAAKDYGVPKLIAYSVTPPRRLTRNGMTNGTNEKDTCNLKEGAEPEFARYLSGILDHFIKEGYPFTALSPINEPDFEWNGVPVPTTQEGSRANNEDIRRQTLAISRELKSRGLKVRILAPEATSPQAGFHQSEWMSKKYGGVYGAYATEFAEHADWRKEVNPIYGYHSYWSDKLEEIIRQRTRLRQELDRSPGMEVWQTEYCQMTGPRGEGGHGRDLGMNLALSVARLIHFDLTLVEASAWQWWLGVSDGDYKDGLIYVDDISRPTGDVFASKLLFIMGNYSRFVRPGYVRVKAEGLSEDVWGTLGTAFKDPASGRVAAVFINTATHTDEIAVSLPGKWSAKSWVTSDRPGHDLKKIAVAGDGKTVVIPSRSVLTVVWEPRRA